MTKINIGAGCAALTCPHCGNKFEQTFGRLKDKTAIDCPRCHQRIRIDAAQFKIDLQRAQKRLDDFTAAVGRIGKKR